MKLFLREERPLESMIGNGWDFWIDAGGTFTDCVARSPEGRIRVYKVLSSGAVKVVLSPGEGPHTFLAKGIDDFPAGFFEGYRITGATREDGNPVVVAHGLSDAGVILTLDRAFATPPGPVDLYSGEPAPLLAIRTGLDLALKEPIGAVSVRLGTTRATNALLERKGAPVVFVTTQGFRDVIRIGYQDRPDLFALHVRRGEPVYTTVIEATERLDKEGNVLLPLDEEHLMVELTKAGEAGCEAVAICFLNSYRNSEHELAAEAIARRVGFTTISRSTALSPTIKIVPRAETAVVDAYLTPVLQNYLNEIASKLSHGKLQLITSAGALISAEAMRGMNMVLSGPAGGVVGYAGTAKAAGFHRAIGFDMGGTSTDVSRFDGVYSYQYETKKAGVRLATPTLAIETVAAGGGSVCSFDGHQLYVGPESAGADPGPACYGKGGPLTVTDMNLYTGRVLTKHFPFPLDREIVDEKLQSLCAEIKKSIGLVYTPLDLAHGFLEIANANMAAAIQKVSLQEGYDVRDYCLVSFGGAAGQHACAIAEQLSMKNVLISPFAGVLSAYGIGMAERRRFATETVLMPLVEEALSLLAGRYDKLEEDAITELSQEKATSRESCVLRRSVELRYRGQGGGLEVPFASLEEMKESFEQAHRRLYGYSYDSRAVELMSLRLEVTEPTPWPEVVLDSSEGAKHGMEMASVSFNGKWVETAVHFRGDLSIGSRLSGPALLREATSVVVVPEGWSATVTERRDILLTADDSSVYTKKEFQEESNEKADPILLQLLTNRLTSIAEQMGTTLQRTSLSVNVKERLDFSCAIFSETGDLIVNAPHVPVHLGAMGETVRSLIASVPTMKPGDVYVTNDPNLGGSHLPDITTITPVFDDEGELLFLTGSRAHHAEVGGKRPGSMPPDSQCLADEGVVLRHFLLIDGGRERYDDLRHELLNAVYPSRSPEENIADLSAQVAANRMGAEKLLEMVATDGKQRIRRYLRFLTEAAEDKMRAALRRLDNGSYQFNDCLDNGATICLRIDVNDDNAKLDFTGTSAVLVGNQNANRAIVTAAVLYCFRCLIGEDVPLNSGVLNPLEVILPECFLCPPMIDDPKRAAAVAAGNVETSQRVVDTIFGALRVVAASQGTMNNLTFGNTTFGYYETICGGTGAGDGFAGCDAIHSHMTNTRMTDAEVFEQQYPVRLWRYEVREGSGGSGEYSGGNGVRREIEFLSPVDLSMMTNRRTTQPYGLAGGLPGMAGRNLLRRAGESAPTDMGPSFMTGVEPGDVLTIETPGGGGFGKP